MIFLDRICNSRTFSESKLNQDLLRYLVKKSMSGAVIKEIIVAMDFFDKGPDFDKTQDSTVRVHVHALRKKLNEYYNAEGKNDALRLSIPKGGYYVEFNEIRQKHFRSPFIIVSAILFLWVTGFAAMTYFRGTHKTSPAAHPVWKEFSDSNRPVLFLIGDHYFFQTGKHPETMVIRKFDINTDTEFDQYQVKMSKQGIAYQKSYWTYLTPHIPRMLLHFISQGIVDPKSCRIKLVSRFQWEDLYKYNIIFIGSFRTLGPLSQIIPEHYTYDARQSYLIFHPDSLKKPVTCFSHIYSDTIVDHSLVFKQTTTANQKILFFLSTHTVGNTSTIEYFTNPDSLKMLGLKNGGQEQYAAFESLFETFGFKLTHFHIKKLYFNALKSEKTILNSSGIPSVISPQKTRKP